MYICRGCTTYVCMHSKTNWEAIEQINEVNTATIDYLLLYIVSTLLELCLTIVPLLSNKMGAKHFMCCCGVNKEISLGMTMGLRQSYTQQQRHHHQHSSFNQNVSSLLYTHAESTLTQMPFDVQLVVAFHLFSTFTIHHSDAGVFCLLFYFVLFSIK